MANRRIVHVEIPFQDLHLEVAESVNAINQLVRHTNVRAPFRIMLDAGLRGVGGGPIAYAILHDPYWVVPGAIGGTVAGAYGGAVSERLSLGKGIRPHMENIKRLVKKGRITTPEVEPPISIPTGAWLYVRASRGGKPSLVISNNLTRLRKDWTMAKPLDDR